jgi:aldehyde oxidoreductase
VRFSVNGTEYVERPEVSDMTLLAYLRSILGLTAAKNGCGEGHCGACTVLIDGRPSRACLVKMADLHGRQIRTLESLARGNTIHALQYAFLEQGAVQCGYCTPGMLMAAVALLERNPEPAEAEVRAALKLNICRCTGYASIVRAVMAAASSIRAGIVQRDPADLWQSGILGIGEPVVQLDGLNKVTGRLKFADDLSVEGMLTARVLRSREAHALVQRIDVTKARAAEGVVAVLTAVDVPGRNAFGIVVADQPVFAERKVLWTGEALAAVYAETESAAEVALDLIDVTYRPLELIEDCAQARSSPVTLHPGRESNLFCTCESGRGDVALGFELAHCTVEDEYRTSFVEHAYLEPESCLAVPEPGGRIRLHVASQGPSGDVLQVAAALGVDASQVHICATPMGGGFGGKEDITVQIIAALGAQCTGRPVKLTLGRRESVRVSTKRHPFSMRYRTGATADGRLVAADCRVESNNGAYASVGESVLVRAASFACGPYEIPHARVRAEAWFTNANPAGAMRGYGSPQVTFASEVQLNRLAERLGIDQFEVRLRNALVAGSTTITGERLCSSVGVRECLLAVRSALARYAAPAVPEGWRIGIGVAASYKNVGIGAGYDDRADATAEVRRDGTLVLEVGCVDMGQGAKTAMAQIAAARLSWPLTRIVVLAGNTDARIDAGMTTASKQTFITGNAVLGVADRLRQRLRTHAAELLGLDPAGTDLAAGGVVADGGARRLCSVEELVQSLHARGIHPRERYEYHPPATRLCLKDREDALPGATDRLHVAYCFGAQAFIVAAEPATGRVRVLKVIAASDVGRAINPMAIRGQMEGGIVMGIGYALSEEYRLEGGRIMTDTLAKLGLQTADATPDIECLVIEDPHEDGPCGAKGMGELPVSMAAPAIVSAIHDALGVWITSLPATPSKVLAALRRTT